MKTRGAAISLLVIALIFGLTTFSCGKSAASTHDDSSSAEDRGILHLEPFVVNLADPEDNRFLRVGVDLGLDKPLTGKENSLFASRIRDSIIIVLSTWRSDSLLAPDGKQKLKDELLKSLQRRVPELGVTEVYFTDFLVQR